jgi:hypothetical protein
MQDTVRAVYGVGCGVCGVGCTACCSPRAVCGVACGVCCVVRAGFFAPSLAASFRSALCSPSPTLLMPVTHPPLLHIITPRPSGPRSRVDRAHRPTLLDPVIAHSVRLLPARRRRRRRSLGP